MITTDIRLASDPISVIEIGVPARWDGPRLHHHAAFDETFYVLDGELTFQLGDDVVTRGSGTVTFAPRGAVHTLANLAEAPARYLLVCTPGGFERVFDPAATEPPPATTFVGPTLMSRGTS